MSIAPQDDHVARARARALAQYERPRFLALVSSIAAQAQALEDGMGPLGNAFHLDTATGDQLDTLAALVGVSRYGLSDDQLRTLCRGVIALNNGSATLATVLAVCASLFQTDQVFLSDGQSGKHQAQVARGQVTVAIGSTKLPDAAVALAKSLIVRGLGAGMDLVSLAQFQSGQAFACAGPQAWVRGYASVANPTTGGRMASLL